MILIRVKFIRAIYEINTHKEAKPLKTRAQIYGDEAADLLRNITMYKT